MLPVLAPLDPPDPLGPLGPPDPPPELDPPSVPSPSVAVEPPHAHSATAKVAIQSVARMTQTSCLAGATQAWFQPESEQFRRLALARCATP